MIEATKNYVEKMCMGLLPSMQAHIRKVALQARLSGLVEAVNFLEKRGMFLANRELTAFVEGEIREEAATCGARVRFGEEKPPAGHHAPPRDDKELEG